ncbi:ATP-binding protein [Paenibacillus sp. UNC499MF]|uniref:ATP-binding response regulator n=1 Tax=Paenibacillus sp. UNC499MF TaxID=1502751 RepID=UPI000CDE97A6|nr:ATP-binding protein [Paenibacillus sp. UNC499MF]
MGKGKEMVNFGDYFKAFFANISTLLTFTYLGSLAYKYILYKIPVNWMKMLYVLLSIAAGWLSMMYGAWLSATVIFDLRFVPILVAPLFLSRPFPIILIGLGIGLARLSFGLNHAAWAGFGNMIILGIVTALTSELLKRTSLRQTTRILLLILIVNLFNVADIAILGVYSAATYLIELAPLSGTAGLFFSFFFTFILHDFKADFLRREALNRSNKELAEQFRLAEERTAELQHIHDELEVKNEELISSSRYKSEFLANMSHELRTPLNSMLILSQFLAENQNGTLSEEEIEFAGIIHTSGQDLLTLINDILDLSKIEAGHMAITLGEVNVSEVVEAMTRMFEPVAAQKGLYFHIRSTGVPDIIHTDEQRLQQILKNLLSNAFKFTERGGVILTFYVEMDAQGVQHPAAAIRDTGIGIRADKREQIFEAFYQADGTTSRKFGGTGLGLSISRQFARLLGGEIRLVSEEGTGSTFTLLLPSSSLSGQEQELRQLADDAKLPRLTPLSSPLPDESADRSGGTDTPQTAPAPATGADTPAEAAQQLLREVTVLVVDDDAANVRSLSALLKSRGAEVFGAGSGRECLRLLALHPGISLVLMDMMMPEMDGRAAIRQIRMDDAYRDLPIIALTARALPGDREACIEAGASDYITKPVDNRALSMLVKQWSAKSV